MPHSGNKNKEPDCPVEQSGQSLAITAEILYLVNLLVLPGIAFIVLWYFFLHHYKHATRLAQCHLRQALSASLWVGVMSVLILVNGLIILSMNIMLGGYDALSTLIVVIFYFTTIHASLIIFGTLGLVCAIVGKHFHYPLPGSTCVELNT